MMQEKAKIENRNQRILVIGPNSFIAKTFAATLEPDTFQTLSVRNDAWLDFDYSSFHSIIYFAAIVHHPEITDSCLYYRVNAEIPHKIALLAAKQGSKKFIYISTVAVYGKGPKFGRINPINDQTPLQPKSLYGKSKLYGEQLLAQVKGLTIQIVRLPNVYGPSCPGTFYHRVEMLAKLKFLPIYKNNYRFSLIGVSNVAKALNRLLSIEEPGVFIPQDLPILSIPDRIKTMAKKYGLNQHQFKTLWPLIWCANKILPKKFTDNLYGGFLVDTNNFPPLTD